MSDFAVDPLEQVTRRLVDVAMGRSEPDLVLTNGRLLDVYSHKLRRDREIWIWRGRIAAIRPAGTAARRRVDCFFHDAQGQILAPGLVDPHVHVESSMVTVCAFAEAALKNGTTTIVCDPHEIANVGDIQGVRWMIEDARRAPLNVFLTVPSTVPATLRSVETCGGEINGPKMGRLLDDWPEAVGAGEKMDYVSIASSGRHSHEIIAEALKRKKPVSGHFYGLDFVAPCAAAGITDTHEAGDADIAEAVLEAGMWLFIRGGPPGSPWDSLPEVIKVLTERGCSSSRVCLCTDDRGPEDLMAYGLDYVVRRAFEAGIPVEVAWAMASLNPAIRYGFDSELGGLAPGRRADVVSLDDALHVHDVWFGGRPVIERGVPTNALTEVLSNRFAYPEAAYDMIKLPPRIRLLPKIPAGACELQVIRLTSDMVTRHVRIRYNGRAPFKDFMSAQDLCFVTVIERHGRGGGVAHGLIQGFGLRKGAVGSSVGHDAHNLVIAGDSEEDMKTALETISRLGGVCGVSGGKALAHVPLPVAGLMSDEPIGSVARRMARLREVWEGLGCTLPFMGFNLISLSVIPELRITDRGLVKVPEMEIISLAEPSDPESVPRELERAKEGEYVGESQ